jgi:hypothetical protein
VQRYRLAWIAHHRDTHEAAVADDPACWIEIDPAGAGQINLDPGVRVSAAGGLSRWIMKTANRRSSSSPITRGSIFRGDLDSSAFPMPTQAKVLLPVTLCDGPHLVKRDEPSPFLVPKNHVHTSEALQ